MVPVQRDPSRRGDHPSGPVRLPAPNAGDFLVFAREHERAASRAFGALPLEEQVRVVSDAPLRDRLTLIRLSRAGEAIVRALPAAEVLFTIKEAGDDAPELIRLASTDQVKVFLDLDCWKRDRLDQDAVQEWLELLAEAPEKLGDLTGVLDMELIVRFLRARVRVWKAESGGQLPPEAPGGLSTLDGVYYLEPLRSGDDVALVRALLLAARMRDEARYGRLLEGAIHEIDAELESLAFQWRTARLTDEGFPALDDALSVYARVDAHRFHPARHKKSNVPEAPGGAGMSLALRTREGDLFLTRAWEAGLREGGWDAVEEEMLHILNAVLIADGIDMGSGPGVRAVFLRAHATLSLGIEAALERADAASEETRLRAAVQLLRDVRLDSLFRLGFTRTLLVRDLALRAAPEGEEKWVAILDPPLGEAVAAARKERPEMWTGLLDAAEPLRREFRTLAEVEIAGRAMRLVAAVRLLWDHLSKITVAGSLEGTTWRAGGIRLSGLILTAFAWHVLEGRPTLTPFPVARLCALLAELFEAHGPDCPEPRIRGDAGARLEEAFSGWLSRVEEGTRPDAEAYLERCLRKLSEETGRLDPDRVDPRAVSALLLRRA